MVCDALDLKGVEGVLDGCDAAITTLGGAPSGDEEKRVDYVGNRNVIESAGILGITRVILVTSVGSGSSREAVSDQVYQVMTVYIVPVYWTFSIGARNRQRHPIFRHLESTMAC